MQKRLVLFSFYDKEGIVDGYVDYLLKELTTVSEKIIAIVNGNVNEIGYKILSKYADGIIIRENKGFDIGAYTDVILNYLEMEELENWDELIFCNDTFYGPFVSMKYIFNTMQKKEIDFWGLNYVDRKALAHIQSYFLVFKKKILSEGKLVKYLKNNISCNETNIKNVYAIFEIGLFKNLVNNGYTYGTYVNTELCDVYKSPCVCMEKYQLPILKKKSMSSTYSDDSIRLNTLYYVNKKTNYDVKYIIENANRVYRLNIVTDDICYTTKFIEEKEIKINKLKYSEIDLQAWVDDSPFYIYGEGMVARNLYISSFKGNTNFLGFLVSNDQEIKESQIYGYPVQYWDRRKNDSAKVIIGVNLENSMELRKILENNENYLYLW